MKNLNITRIGVVSLLLLISVFLFRCTTEKSTSQSKQTIKEPFKNVKIAAQTYAVDAEKGGEIKLENGTRIMVPPNAFVDKNGQPVSGQVDLKYREFHSAVDIMVSGIPMKMTDGGEEYDFESAGMFEIKGYSGANEIAIADGKDLKVQLASFKPEENYNHYYFDEEKGEWKELASAVKPEKNPDFVPTQNLPTTAEGLAASDGTATENVAAPLAPKKYDPNATVLNLNVDYDKYPYLKEFNGIVWQYAGDDEANDPKNNAWLMKEKWSSVSLELADAAASTFNLKVVSGKNTYEALVVPALSGKAFDKALAKYQSSLTAYNTRQARIAAMNKGSNESYNKHAEIVRAFTISSFGIYNCDRYRSDDGLFAINWKVELGDDGFDNANMYIYHICKTDNTVTYCYPNAPTIKFDPKKDNVLMAVLPDDKVAVFGKDDFAKMNSKGLKDGGDYTFRFNEVNRKFSSTTDISKFVDGI